MKTDYKYLCHYTKVLFCIITCVFFTCKKSALESPKDSKQQDSITVKLLKKTYKSLKSKDTTTFLQLNEKADVLTRSNQDTIGMAEVNWNYASYYLHKDITDKSFYHYNKAYQLYAQVDKTYYSAKMLYNMAVIKELIKDYTGSEILVVKALKIFKTLKRDKNSYRCYNLLGVINNELEDYEKSIFYFERAIFFLNKTKQKGLLLEGTLNNLGLAYKNNNELDKANEFFEKALQNEKLKSNNAELYAKLIDNLGHNNLLKGLLNSSSRKYLIKAKQIRDSINDLNGLSISYLHLSQLKLVETDTSEAINYLKKALVTAKKLNYNKVRLKSLKELAGIDKAKSAKYLNDYVYLNDSLQKEDRKIRNKFTRISYETDEYVLEKEKLSRDKKRLSIILFVTALVFVMFGYIIYERNKIKNLRFEREQQQANEKIYNLLLVQSNILEKGKQQERDRISEELHDGILGRLFGTRLSLEFIECELKPEEQKGYERLIDNLHDIEKEIRVISHELKSDIFSSNFTFESVVNSLIDEQKAMSSYEVNYSLDEVIIWENLSNTIKINFYRILQEAFFNITKYANATLVDVIFVKKDSSISLTIKDNGVGFNPKLVKKGIGQINMASRVKKLDGYFKIISNTNKGTMIKVSLPIKNEA